MRLSIILEWANTRLQGTPRAWDVLDAIGAQWQAIACREYPDALTPAARAFLEGLEPRAELLIVSGDGSIGELAEEMRRRVPPSLELGLHVSEGLEYYPLKNYGSERATGDLLLFVDSDVLPEEGWLAQLLGSFARPEIDVVRGQTYIAPTDLLRRAFALGWIFDLREGGGQLLRTDRLFTNNVAFRADVFRRTGFPEIGRRTRGAASLLRAELDRSGIPVWENRRAQVDHPPPTSLRHLAVRAFAHGRDYYMATSEERSSRNLARSVEEASRLLGRGYRRTLRDWRRVGLQPREVPAALAILSSYYGLFALGGLLTHAAPEAMSRRFRV